MTIQLAHFFEHYGVTVQAEREGNGSFSAKAFVQPLWETDKEFPFAVTALGSVDDRRWLCLTQEALQEGDRIRLGEKVYTAVNCAAVYLGEQVCHWRSILLPEREAAL